MKALGIIFWLLAAVAALNGVVVAVKSSLDVWWLGLMVGVIFLGVAYGLLRAGNWAWHHHTGGDQPSAPPSL